MLICIAKYNFIGFDLGMISFKGRNISIINADRITRHVNSAYPHLSESKSILSINHGMNKYAGKQTKTYGLANLKLRLMSKMNNLRYRSGLGIEQFKIIIDNLKNYHLGNCYESAILAQIIGKINGQKNIYPAQIYFTKNSSGKNMQFDHAVAVITDKAFEKDYKYQFKNKDAIIVDPWLGVTEFAGEYINKLRTLYFKMFPGQLSDYSNKMKILALESKTIKEFNQKRKEIFKPEFYFKLHDEEVLSMDDAKILGEEFPELIIKNY